MKYLLVLFLAMLNMTDATAHSGRTDYMGCHIDNRTGTRHCH